VKMPANTRMELSPQNLDSLSHRFLIELERVVPRESFCATFTDRLTVTIPARDVEVGAITVCLDGDEITVVIGELHHCHFDGYSSEVPSDEQWEQRAAENAAHFIQDVLADHVMLRVEFKNGRCLGSQSWYPDTSDGGRLLAGADEVREYVWSHRIR
jgi:hypothetical protein